MISIVIPTIPGREEHYERCARAYSERTTARYELITEYDHPTVGLAWQAGASRAKGDYVHLTCDDLEPLHGWDKAAMAVADHEAIPAPRVTDARTGALQCRPQWGQETPEGTDTGITIVPFLSREQWEAVQPLFTGHYFTDDFISDRARAQGWISVMCNGYAFKHHWAQHRRGAGMTEPERMHHDHRLYNQALAMVARGEWTEPWPDAS
jgi:hypothetical protein